MSTTTNATQSMSVNGTSSTTILNDPRAYVDFENKAKFLKLRIKSHLKTVLNEVSGNLELYVRKNCILSGSSISSIYHGETPKDYDLWFKDGVGISTVKTYIEGAYPDAIAEFSEEYDGMKKTGKVITKNAITFKNKMQMIVLGDYQTERKTFDFVHCMPYYDFEEDKFYISEHQMSLITRKKLEANPGGKTPLQWRIEKFKQRGWTF